MKKNTTTKKVYNIIIKHIGSSVLHEYHIEATNKNDAIATATYRTNAAHNFTGMTQVIFIA